MSLNRWTFLGLVAVAAMAVPTVSSAKAPINVVVDDFVLPAPDGSVVTLVGDSDTQWTVVCFLGTECPLARVYGPRLQRMSQTYRSRGVRFVGVNSNVQDSMDDLRDYISEHEIGFPIGKDYDRTVAVQMHATRTPEVFVVDSGGVVRYHGRIDDQYQPGLARAEATEHDLRNALDQLIAGQDVIRPETDAVGCLISLPREKKSIADQQVTFCNQVIRVFQKHCTECHREGEIGPFVLDDYDEVVGWVDMSLEVIDQGRMPPWHAENDHGLFANARSMPESDKQLLRQWADAGAPYGDPTLLPPEPDYVKGWRLPEAPHAVYAMSEKPFQIPSEGTVEYQYFVVDPGFEEDKWIRAVEVIPGNRAVVHHCIVFTRPPDGADFRDIGMLSAYVPGQRTGTLPDGYAQRVPARSKIVFQVHYTPSGKPESDITKIGMVFAEPETVTHEVYVVGGIDQEFEIPPGAANHTVRGRVRGFPKDGFLLSITPHMHLRGKSYRLSAHTKSSETLLLNVPRYDFNWQHNYEFKEPMPLGEVDSLVFAATFDNSKDNPANPNPDEYVTWGDQTWQEMAVTFVGVARPLGKTEWTAESPSEDDLQLRVVQRREQLRRQAEAEADQYIARHDANGDGRVSKRELPGSVRRYGYLDHNRDGQVSRDELAVEFMHRHSSGK